MSKPIKILTYSGAAALMCIFLFAIWLASAPVAGPRWFVEPQCVAYEWIMDNAPSWLRWR